MTSILIVSTLRVGTAVPADLVSLEMETFSVQVYTTSVTAYTMKQKSELTLWFTEVGIRVGCVSVTDCPANSDCVGNEESYSCHCRTGYTTDANDSCIGKHGVLPHVYTLSLYFYMGRHK